jgi:acyl dehydratase
LNPFAAHEPISLAALARRQGEEIGMSDWIEITQAMIDAFAQTTGDHYFIHTDPARAAGTQFGGTIAHGFLTLSLLSRMAYAVVPRPAGASGSLNFGFDKVRFVSPVRTGKRIRGRFTLEEARLRSPREALTRYRVAVEIEGETRPALAADWLTLHLFETDQDGPAT